MFRDQFFYDDQILKLWGTRKEIHLLRMESIGKDVEDSHFFTEFLIVYFLSIVIQRDRFGFLRKTDYLFKLINLINFCLLLFVYSRKIASYVTAIPESSRWDDSRSFALDVHVPLEPRNPFNRSSAYHSIESVDAHVHEHTDVLYTSAYKGKAVCWDQF